MKDKILKLKLGLVKMKLFFLRELKEPVLLAATTILPSFFLPQKLSK